MVVIRLAWWVWLSLVSWLVLVEVQGTRSGGDWNGVR